MTLAAHTAMDPMTLTAWVVVAVLGVALTALFAGLETGTYCLNRVRLHIRARTGRGAGAILLALFERPNRLLAALLIGTNLASYAASLAIANILQSRGMGHLQVILVEVAILTPVLFVFAEVLPKDLFREYADQLMYPFARPLLWLHRLLFWCGLLPLIDGISATMARLLHSDDLSSQSVHPGRTVARLLKEGMGHGLISSYQSDLIDRVLTSSSMCVKDVMVPWSSVTTARASGPPEAIWALADRVPYARVPLMDTDDAVVGILTLFDVLVAEPEAVEGLEGLARPARRLDPAMPLRKALNELQQHHASMGIVGANDQAPPLGLVTIKDLVEPLLGELEIW